MKPTKKEDIPEDVRKELEKQLSELYPGMEIKYAAECPPPSEEAQKQIQQMHRKHQLSIRDGTCVDCGAKMPNYEDLEENDDWKPAEGWSWFTEPNDTVPLFWQCPACGTDVKVDLVELSDESKASVMTGLEQARNGEFVDGPVLEELLSELTNDDQADASSSRDLCRHHGKKVCKDRKETESS